jgi:DNA-binding XRE family transcriptional regulator
MNSIERKVAKRVGEIFYSARKKMDLTQEAFGKKLGLSQGLISRVEGGIGLPGLVEWIRFCEFTDTPCDAFWKGLGKDR